MSEEDDLHTDALDAIMGLENGRLPEWLSKKIRIAQARPDLMFMPGDSDAEIARKSAEFDALMLAGEVKH